jgi:transcriptional regulator with XRE-family HTH domain
MSFKENLKAEIAYKNILVKELAALSGVKKRSIDNYLRENGSIPSVDAAVNIARALGVSVEYLVTGYEYRQKPALFVDTPEMRLLALSFQKLDKEDRKIVLNLIKCLKERENVVNETIPVAGNE